MDLSSIDIQSFVLGLFRIAFFMAALVHGVYMKRIAQASGFSFATVGSLVFLFENSGFSVGPWLFDIAIVTATPAAAFMAAAAMWGSNVRNENWDWL